TRSWKLHWPSAWARRARASKAQPPAADRRRFGRSERRRAFGCEARLGRLLIGISKADQVGFRPGPAEEFEADRHPDGCGFAWCREAAGEGDRRKAAGIGDDAIALQLVAVGDGRDQHALVRV